MLTPTFISHSFAILIWLYVQQFAHKLWVGENYRWSLYSSSASLDCLDGWCKVSKIYFLCLQRWIKVTVSVDRASNWVRDTSNFPETTNDRTLNDQHQHSDVATTRWGLDEPIRPRSNSRIMSIKFPSSAFDRASPIGAGRTVTIPDQNGSIMPRWNLDDR